MSTEPLRHALNGATMGTRWSALFFARPGPDPEPIRRALQAAVDDVDTQMSTWKPDSDLMRLNAAPVGAWVAVPERLGQVLRLGLKIGRASGGAFDIGMGDAATAWGFGPLPANPDGIRRAMTSRRAPAHDALEIDAEGGRVRKTQALALDLNGIAKGYGVDRLAETVAGHGIGDALVGIDGELRAIGLRPDGQPWTVAVEAPDADRRAVHSMLTLQDAAVATSGDYRHWVEVRGHRLSHTMDPNRRAPVLVTPASVTVVARTCAEADAWATACMVKGSLEGMKLAREQDLSVLFIDRAGHALRETRVGRPFEAPLDPHRVAAGDRSR